MHCKYKGCKITTRNGHRNINWEKWQLCKEHAWKLHKKELKDEEAYDMVDTHHIRQSYI